MRFIQMLSAVLFLSLSVSSHALAAEPAPAEAAKCTHGVKKTLCTRCNPKLAPVFKAKGDWCAEHERPESQCALCNPGLAKQGVK
ncbi:MAG: hypothetical protein ACYC8T_39520 [Myxococcaceae bacterium]